MARERAGSARAAARPQGSAAQRASGEGSGRTSQRWRRAVMRWNICPQRGNAAELRRFPSTNCTVAIESAQFKKLPSKHLRGRRGEVTGGRADQVNFALLKGREGLPCDKTSRHDDILGVVHRSPSRTFSEDSRMPRRSAARAGRSSFFRSQMMEGAGETTRQAPHAGRQGNPALTFRLAEERRK